VLHVYDKLHLDRIPRRYTVESGKTLTDTWLLHPDAGRYDLWVYGPNGFVREFRGNVNRAGTHIDTALEYDIPNTTLRLILTNREHSAGTVKVQANAYHNEGPSVLTVAPGRQVTRECSLIGSHGWYDFTIVSEAFEHRFAGRLETGAASYSDPAV
jgi:phospholipase C